jgi:hypothetical protein
LIRENKDQDVPKYFLKNKQKNLYFRKDIFLKKSESLRTSGCVSLKISEEKKCDLKKEKVLGCLKDTNFTSPVCLTFDTPHVKKPDQVRAVYFSSYGASRKDRIDQLIKLVKETEVNSVVIDVKEINGEVYFKIPTENFGEIKPEFDVILRNPKDLIKKLHQNGIYIIARVVLFKDKNLAQKRKDLAVKKKDKKTI